MSPVSRSFVGMLLVALIGLAGCVVLIVLTDRTKEDVPETVPTVESHEKEVPKELGPERKDERVVPAAVPRRMKVAGQDGYFVVIELDGSSYLESPDGKRTLLADAGPALVTPKPPVTVPPLERRPVGQLVVCDNGVVDVPLGAIITFIGRDKVVTHTDDGGSIVYYTDGRIEHHGRPERTETPTRKP